MFDKANTLFKLKERKTILKDFYVFDTETAIKKGDLIKYDLTGRPENFVFGVVYGHNFSKVIHTVDEFKKEFLKPRYKNKKVFAHNAIYDLGVLFGDIFSLDCEALFTGSRFICCSNGNCMFADSFNIFQTSAANLGEMQGKPKLSLSYKWQKGIKKQDIIYCIRDCEIIFDALIEIFNEVGDIKITQASLAMNYFRRHYLPFNISKNKHCDAFWDSYFGGRTEAFKIGKTHASVIDVNSMYPKTMRDTMFPNPRSLKKITGLIKKSYFIRLLNDYEGCAQIEVTHNDTYFGFLPVRKDGKLIFPTGTFSGCWNFNEIRFALQYKAIKINKIEWVVYGLPMKSIFDNFITDLYLKRLSTTNAFEKYRIKIFMNSLYGKFAQRIKHEEIYLDNINTHFDLIQQSKKDNTFISLRMFNQDRTDGFLILKSKKIKSFSHSIPSFASYITSEARLILLRKLLELEKNGVVYCDTDSVFVERLPLDFVDSDQLGGWKLEEKIITEINGLKNYRYIVDGEEKRKLKGVPKNAEEIEKNVFVFTNLVKAKESLVRGLDMNVRIERKKKISNVYDKREIIKEDTKPIKL